MGNNSNKIKLCSLILVTLPIFGQYSSFIPGVSLGDLLLLFVMLTIIINKNLKINIRKNRVLCIFWYYALISSLVSFLFQQVFYLKSCTRFIRFSFYVLAIILLTSEVFYKEHLINYYRILSLLISIYIILQFFIYKIFGILLPIKILPLEWIDGRVYGTQEALLWASVFYLRPSGIFAEPGYAAQYLIPGVLLSLYGWYDISLKNNKIRDFVIILSAIILTTSSQGLYLSLFIVFVYIIQRFAERNTLDNMMNNVIIVILGLFVFVFFINSIIFERSVVYVLNNIRGGSTGLRIFRGIAVYLKLPLLYKVIGVGHGNIGNYVINNNITTIYDPMPLDLVSADYTNAISQSLLYYGIIGLVLMTKYYISIIKKSSMEIKPLTIVFFMMTFISSVFFNLTTIFYMILILSSEVLNNKKKVI